MSLVTEQYRESKNGIKFHQRIKTAKKDLLDLLIDAVHFFESNFIKSAKIDQKKQYFVLKTFMDLLQKRSK